MQLKHIHSIVALTLLAACGTTVPTFSTSVGMNASWVQSTPTAEKQKRFRVVCAEHYGLAPGTSEMLKCTQHLDIRSRAMRARTRGSDWPRPDDVWFCPIPPGVKLFYGITECQNPPESVYGRDIWRIE